MGKAFYLTPSVVKAGLELLATQSIHPVVALFLDISHFKTLHGKKPGEPLAHSLADLCNNYECPYGPPNKPLLFPFASRNRRGVLGLFRNANLAGSFAPSSIRSADSKTSLIGDDRQYRYPENPAEFLDEKLAGERPPTWAVAAFYLRNAVFVFDKDTAPDLADLVDVFKASYGLDGLTEFDDSVKVASKLDFPDAFVPADSTPDVAEDHEKILLPDQTEVGLYVRRRNPEIIASDLSDELDDPRDRSLSDAVKQMLEEFGGVILVGPPGTSKSYTAQEIAMDLTNGEEGNQFYVQFHSSYQYEDFMEGYRPTENGGFARKEGVLLQACARASGSPESNIVLIIDEISRADVGRVFGEALTYIETSKRGTPFLLPSGFEATIPANLKIIATMNSLDRGANDIDEAFGRRFAFFDVPPDPDLIDEVLPKDSVQDVRERIKNWMRTDLELAKEAPRAAVGHAFFVGIRNDLDAKRRWEYQLERYLSHALVGQPEVLQQLVDAWASEFPSDNE